MAGFHDITAAVIGAGFIGPVHVEGLRRVGIRVKGIAGISPEEAQRAAATLGLPHAVPQRRRAAGRSRGAERPSRLAEPPAPRAALAALAAGKHVICEKPLAMTSAQTAELVQAGGSGRRRWRR